MSCIDHIVRVRARASVRARVRVRVRVRVRLILSHRPNWSVSPKGVDRIIGF